MFDSKKFGVDSVGLHQCVYDSIVKCGADIQPELFKNIVLSGGNTLFPGISSRLKT